MDNKELSTLLTKLDLITAEVAGSDGGSILAVNAGTRVLRLTGKSGHDFFWMHDAVTRGDVSQPLGSKGWPNLGGDRTWVGPEADLFISDLADPWNTYEVPVPFDPGNYEISSGGSTIRMSGTFDVTNHRLASQARLKLDKVIRAAQNPFRHSDDAEGLLSAEYIGYEQSTTLTMLSEAGGMRFGLWHLAQLRPSGEMLVALTHMPRFHTYFGDKDSAQMRVEDGVFKFAVDGTDLRKIGIKADCVTGRIGYLQHLPDGSSTLIVRNIDVNPSAQYVDTPWDKLDDTGYAVQCFSADVANGSFAELEYHTPGVGDGTGVTSYTDRSQLWAFKADRQTIEPIAARLLARIHA
jgi:hypothetical protein